MTLDMFTILEKKLQIFTWNVHLSQIKLRSADLWKGAFQSELLLKVGK